MSFLAKKRTFLDSFLSTMLSPFSSLFFSASSETAILKIAESLHPYPSPSALLLMLDNEINPKKVVGSGFNKRIIKGDVLSVLSSPNTLSAAILNSSAQPSTQPQSKPSTISQPPPQKQKNKLIGPTINFPRQPPLKYTLSPISLSNKMQRVSSYLEAGHYHLNIDIDVDAAHFIMNMVDTEDLTIADFFIKAAGMAAQKVPKINSQWSADAMRESDTSIVQYLSYNEEILDGFDQPMDSVAIPLADQKSLSQIVLERTQNFQSTSNPIGQGTITVLDEPTVNYIWANVELPHSTFLTIGAEREVVQADETTYDILTAKDLFTSKLVTVSLSCDHRVVDGAIGAEFLQEIKRLVESPTLMI